MEYAIVEPVVTILFTRCVKNEVERKLFERNGKFYSCIAKILKYITFW